MRIVAIGVNHATGPLDVRERLAIPTSELPAALAVLKAVVHEGFIVSTCNRVEVYAVVGHAASGAEILWRFLSDRSGLDVASVRDACYVYAGGIAVRHLLRVASGLDSMVLGEDQIQHQVKRALSVARETNALGATLERLGSAALACGKRVRTYTDFGRHTVSLESLAVRATRLHVDELASASVVVLGAGASASLVLRHLRSAGVSRISVVSRSLARARLLATRAGADITAHALSDLRQALTDARVVFACTSAPKPVITPAALSHRKGDALLCVDLAMPRAAHDSVTALPGVSMVTLDELGAMAESHRASRRKHLPAAEAIVDAETDRFLEWCSARGVAQAITTLNVHADNVAAHELERAMPRLKSLTPQQREIVAELAHRIVRKLVHRPINALKNHAEAENMALVIEYLFGASGASYSVLQQLSAPQTPTDAPARKPAS